MAEKGRQRISSAGRLNVLFVCSVAVMMAALTGLSVANVLTPRGFGVAGLSVMVAAAVVYPILLRRGGVPDANAPIPDAAIQNDKTDRIRLYIRLFVGLVFLADSVWFVWRAQWVRALIGAMIFLIFFVGSLVARRRRN